jgi:acetolactate decarboxylase
VCLFRPERRIVLLKAENLKKLEEALNNVLTPKEAIHAIRIQGLFPYVKARTVPAQQKPYPGLAEVIKRQKVFELRNVRGTLIGFRFPKTMAGLNVIGYHFHFITDDKQAGGHVLDCAAKNPNVEIALFPKLHMTFSAVKSRAQRLLPRMPQKILESLKALPGKAQ